MVVTLREILTQLNPGVFIADNGAGLWDGPNLIEELESDPDGLWLLDKTPVWADGMAIYTFDEGGYISTGEPLYRFSNGRD